MTVIQSPAAPGVIQYASPEVRVPAAVDRPGRLVSLDALRGFDMIWILGGEEVIKSLANTFPNRFTEFLRYEFDHAQWEGFHVYDLIFPLFVFIVGVSLIFSLGKLMATRGRAAY